MKKFAMILAGAALALTGAAASAKSTLAQQGEAKLARMLEGRVAGEPVNCISAMNSNRIEVIEHVGIVYDSGGTIWVGRVKDPDMLGRWDVPVIERFSSQLCTTDMIRTVDRSNGHFTGAVFLEDFVPYTRQG
jgi:hypothetical protein